MATVIDRRYRGKSNLNWCNGLMAKGLRRHLVFVLRCFQRNDTEESAAEYDEIAEKRHKKLRAARPQAKELDHGFHGFHGQKLCSPPSALPSSVPSVPSVVKIFAKRSDSDGLQFKSPFVYAAFCAFLRLFSSSRL
jgi:hypothetical protein